MTTSALTVELASGEALDIRDFSVEEGISQLFDVRLTAVSTSPDVDFEAAVGAKARFEIQRTSAIDGETRYWSGICARAEQIGVEETGLSTYALRIVPALWLLSQRRNYRVFQDKSELDIVLQVLAAWNIEPRLELDAASYGKRRMRVQYAESDLDFVSRLLEDIGVAYYFEQAEGESLLVLADAPNRRAPREALPFVDKPNERVSVEYVTDVRTRREVRPGRYTQSDVDYRKALNYPLAASASRGGQAESRLERYHHNYGSFLWKGQGGDTPVADDRGAARTNEREGARQVERRIEAQREGARVATFRTIAHDLRPGKVFTISGHPRGELAAPLLVVAGRFSGVASGDWAHTCEARYTDIDYRPPLRTPKPHTRGVESATVTGPAGEEIHTDEFGRVRVHFHWDREGAADETSSCWIPVSQAWAGAGFGAISPPRVGQEVLVDFLGEDPDRPIVMGRVFTTTTPPPYALPRYKMVSGMRSETYPRPRPQGAPARMGGGPDEGAALDLRAPVSPAPVSHPPVARAPAGGGMPLGGLGTGEAPAAAPAGGQGAGATAMPGIFGGVQAAQEELAAAVGRMRSLGPDQADHGRSANGIVFDDQAGSERVYLQGENDLFITVKRNLTSSIGNNRAFSVQGNDYEEIRSGYQATRVGKDRTVEVTGKQAHMVEEDIILRGGSRHIVSTHKDAYTETVEGGQVFQAKNGFLFRVGTTSAIVITPTAIILDAQKVYINPGPEVMEAVYRGQPAEEAVQDHLKEERIRRAVEALVRERYTRMDRPSSFARTEAGRRRFDEQQQQELRSAANGGTTPYTLVAQRSTQNPEETRAAARRAHEIMYGPVPQRQPQP